MISVKSIEALNFNPERMIRICINYLLRVAKKCTVKNRKNNNTCRVDRRHLFDPNRINEFEFEFAISHQLEPAINNML